MTKFEKKTLHRGGSIPFWDWRWSAHLTIDVDGDKKIWLHTSELIDLKKLLNDFDGRTGSWKNKVLPLTTGEQPK